MADRKSPDSTGREETVGLVEGVPADIDPPQTPAAKNARRRHVRRPKYTIEELVEGMDPDAPLTAEQKAWRDDPPTGHEVS